MHQRLALTAFIGLLLAALVAPARAQVFPIQEPDIYGAPQFQSWPAGYYIWADEQGLHVRWTSSAGTPRRFYGEVTTTQGAIVNFRPVYPERGGIFQRRANAIGWDIVNAGGGEGFDFALAAADTIRFSLTIDSRQATRNEIFLGRRGLHPADNPFALRIGAPVGVVPPNPEPGPIGVVPPNPGPGPIVVVPPNPGPGPYPFDRWPAYVRGQPRVNFVNSPGYLVWLDDGRWHLRWTMRRWGRSASGLVSTDGRFNDVRRVSFEEGDLIARHESLIAWEARAEGRSAEIDGIDFRTNGDRLTFTLLVDGTPVSPSLIFLGAGATRPARNPFTITR
jgi:hypothetical protein